MKSFGMVEKEIQHHLATDKIANDGLKSILGIKNKENIEFKREEVFVNGISVDIMIYTIDEGEIYSLIECKGTNINVTEYVRGIGQVLQYEYFYEDNIPPNNNSNFNYREEFQTLLILTSDFMKKTNINIAKFKYPKTLKIVEMNTQNYNLRVINPSEIKKIDKNTDENTRAFNFYYFRDNRVFELYILLKILNIIGLLKRGFLNRKDIEKKYLSRIKVINNGNWRNAFITLSSVGLIDDNNRPTEYGGKLSSLKYEEFAYEIYVNYLKDYIDCILKVIIEKDLMKATNTEISESIKSEFFGDDILYLTQSKSRYISSFLNIMRDDYGILTYSPRSRNRKLNYKIFELNEKFVKKEIKERTIASKYIDSFLLEFTENR